MTYNKECNLSEEAERKSVNLGKSLHISGYRLREYKQALETEDWHSQTCDAGGGAYAD